jgi:iron(III) transport system permease protein
MIVHGKSIDIFACIMLAVAVAASLAVFGLIGTILWLSLRGDSASAAESLYTLSHYRDVLANPFVYRVLVNTFLYSGVAVSIAMIFGIPIAWLVERTDLPGKSLVFTLMTVSLVIPGFSVALGWVFLLHPRVGLINILLIATFGLDEAPFNIASIVGMAAVEGLSLASVAFIMTSAALRSMDPALEEAAAIAGAGTLKTTWTITLPAVSPALLGAVIYIFTIGFSSFDIPAIIGMPNRIFTLATYIYSELNPNIGRPRYGGVAALGMVMVVLAAVLTWTYSRVQRQASKYTVVTGRAYRPRTIALKRGRITAISFVVCYFVIAQALPLLVLAWAAGLPYLQVPSATAFAQWSFDNFERVPMSLVARALNNTLLLMVFVPTLTLAISLAISWVILRSKILGGAIFDFFAFLPQAIPSIVLSVAALLLALFAFSGAAPIYGTVWLLIAVYTISRVGYGTRITNAGLVQIHGELEEAARLCGATSYNAMRTILVPLLAPTLLYSWIWLALLAYRELTLPVLLSTTSNQPISVVVWGFVAASSYGQASAVILAMLGFLLPALFGYWFVVRRVGLVAVQ